MNIDGSNPTEIIPNDWRTSFMIKTDVLVDVNNSFLYWSTSRTQGKGGARIYRTQLHGDYSDHEVFLDWLNGTKIMALAQDSFVIEYETSTSSSGWAWYIYLSIVVGSLIVGALAFMASCDVLKLCRSVPNTTEQQKVLLKSEEEREEEERNQDMYGKGNAEPPQSIN